LIRHLEYTRARLAQRSGRLREHVYPDVRSVDELLVAGPVDRISWGEAQGLDYRPVEIGERFGPLWATFWLRVRATVPGAWSGARVDLLFASRSEATLWENGRVVQGLNTGGGGERPEAEAFRSGEDELGGSDGPVGGTKRP